MVVTVFGTFSEGLCQASKSIDPRCGLFAHYYNSVCESVSLFVSLSLFVSRRWGGK